MSKSLYLPRDILRKIHGYKYDLISRDQYIGNIVFKVISGPYMFSDHENKDFEKQYNFLNYMHPELWEMITIDEIKTHIRSAEKKAYYLYSD